jgi:hypothetical protein
MDIDLAPFPHSGGHSIFEAMGAGKPVVVLRFPPDSNYNSGAELVGIRELIAGQGRLHRNRRPFAENRRIPRSSEPGHSRSFSFAIQIGAVGRKVQGIPHRYAINEGL